MAQYDLIYALPRTGSTTLLHILNLHPNIRLANEPHVAKNPPYDVTVHTGMKHVWLPNGFPFADPKRNDELLLGARNVIVLNRRNGLQRIVCREMCMQSGIWGCSRYERQAIMNFRFKPLELDKLRAELALESAARVHPGLTLSEKGKLFMAVWYEDLFRSSPGDRWRLLHQIFAHFGFKISDRDWIGYGRRIDALVADTRDTISRYSLVPNAREIDQELGSEELGRLL